MKKLRIYLDTSIVNFLFADDAPDFRRVTEDFFAVQTRKQEGYWHALRLLSPLEVEDENQT
jgi:hypothetical protein